MRRVVVGRPTGFCSGVERAIRLAKEGRDRYGQVRTLGQLVHNPQVLAELEKQGIRTAGRSRWGGSGAVVVRAHGCAPAAPEEARRRGLTVIDATCPYVRKVQNVARRLAEGGYEVVVVGERNHPEVKGILAHCGGRGRVYAAGMRPLASRVGVVAQTTLDREGFQQAVAKLARLRYTELRVFDTICEEVVARQRAVARIAGRVDIVVVVGGRNSANTSRLAAIARAAGRKVLHVERATDLPAAGFPSGKTVGVVAGSSTPSWVVREIVRRAQNPSQGGP
ncbi:4-hydroxy-3-methylbut-2-enyl diphosphate reductase [candidate division WOR-3 bacterium]|nr:4-hydroxy-3-methylbut-2-enyl diphosphate reductase [candidate division WOR-3 bacterium]